MPFRLREEVGPLVFVEMDEHFGVALRAKTMAGSFQPGSQLTEVVDFAVEDNPHGVVFVAQGLPATGPVDDGQTPMPQGDACWKNGFRSGAMPTLVVGMAPIHIDAFIIRAAMTQHVDHPLEGCPLHGLFGVRPNCTGNAAHPRDSKLEIRNWELGGSDWRGVVGRVAA